MIRKSIGFTCLVGIGCILLAIFDHWDATDGAWTGAAIGIPLGLCGALCGGMLMTILLGNGHMMTWMPAGLADSRRIGLRECLPKLVYWLLVALAIALAGHWVRPTQTLAATAAAGGLAFLAGACFLGGKWSSLALCAAVIGGFLTLVFGRNFFAEVATPSNFAANAWPPSLVWSAINGLAAVPTAAAIACALMVAESMRGWWRIWRTDVSPHIVDDMADDALAPDEDDDEMLEPEIRDDAWPRIPTAERAQAEASRVTEWRHMIRGHFLTPRSRRLAVFGEGHAQSWFANTRFTALFFAVAVCMVLLHRHAPALALPARITGIISSWFIPVTLISIFLGFAIGWPGRNSAFAWMTQPRNAFGMGVIPPFAAFPLAARDWLGGTAREWLARSLWVGAMMLALLVILMEREFWQTWVPGQIALVALPWWLLWCLFPLQVIHRISLATSGAMFRPYGATRTIPALALAAVCPLAGFTAVVATAGEDPKVAAWAFAIALSAGAVSLRLALARAEHPRMDLKS